jgi:hypothetical protein
VKLAGGRQIDVSYRKMIYGRNLLSYKMERKFGGAKVPVVKVISCDLSQKGPQMHLEAQYPLESATGTRASSVAADGSNSHSEPLVVYQPGIVDVTRLQTIAEQIHNEIGRGELGGSASTKDLSSLGGDNADTDLLTLRPGDAIEFAVDAAGLGSIPSVVSELNTQAAASSQQLVQRIVDRLGFDADLAAVLVGTARGQFAGIQNVFRVANVKYSWDIATGIGVDFDFQNYIEARYDQASAATYEYGVLTAQAPAYEHGALNLTAKAGG